jgi:arsenate reductase (thioredoxin)
MALLVHVMLIESISHYCQHLTAQFDEIPVERKALLKKISQYIQEKLNAGREINLMYVCTHNSRRSHFGQIWAAVAAEYYGITGVRTYSGGTESTAFNPNAISALERIGFRIEVEHPGDNPKYLVHYGAKSSTRCFSKVFDDAENPQHEFAAVMTCSDAEENCPFIPGVELRIGTTYDDPKAFDHTPLEAAKYDERCRQIALETLYVFAPIKKGS